MPDKNKDKGHRGGIVDPKHYKPGPIPCILTNDYVVSRKRLPKKLDYYDLLGKPWRLGARGPEYYDCWGICLELAKRVGIYLPEGFTPEDTVDQDIALREGRDRYFTKLQKPEPYSIVAFNMTPELTDHCGLVLENCTHFIHSMRNHHVVVLRLDHRIMARKFEGYYRYHG